MQGGQICCFSQAAAFALPYSCNSVQLAPPTARWENLFWVLLSPVRQLSDPTQPHFGRLACCSTPALCLCYFSHLGSLTVWFLASPLFSSASSAFYPIPTVHVRLQFAVYVFQFCWREFNLPKDCAGLCFHRLGGVVACGACYSPVGSADLCRLF
jgi:hypothetical protein